MKRARIGVIAAAILAVATLAWAQKQDFSGNWTRDAEKSDPMGGRGGGGATGTAGTAPTVVLNIKQTADTITVERKVGENPLATITYKLDGTEATNTMAGRGGGPPMTAKFVSKWDGNKLVTSITREGQQGTVTLTETMYIEGGNLITETKNPGREGGPEQTRKQVYKKGT
jgi:hypothetical protein